MATHKSALIRYKTIDDCLRNSFRKWTLEDLIAKVSEALYEHEGITGGVSRRTIQADLQMMRSDRLGYNAPIAVAERKYYFYETEGYSITNSPINHADMEKMQEIVSVLKQLNGFSYFDEMSDMIARLENTLHKSSGQKKNCIQFESNAQLKGLEHVSRLYQAIVSEMALMIEYKSFRAAASQHKVYYPYLLKEYRNRWFLTCRPKKGNVLVNLALDRIIDFHELAKEPFEKHEGVDFDRYYSDLIGVTKTERDRGQRVILHFDKANGPYVLTKPLHHSQQVLKDDQDGVVIRIDVVLNFELEREILGFGEFVKVLSPRSLITRIQKRLDKAALHYAPVPGQVT